MYPRCTRVLLRQATRDGDLQALYRSPDGLEPSTPSLPWRLPLLRCDPGKALGSAFPARGWFSAGSSLSLKDPEPPRKSPSLSPKPSPNSSALLTTRRAARAWALVRASPSSGEWPSPIARSLGAIDRLASTRHRTESLQLHPRVERAVRPAAEAAAEELGDCRSTRAAGRARPRRPPRTDSGGVAGGAQLCSESRAGMAAVKSRVVGSPVPDHVERPPPVDVEVVDDRVEAGAVRPRVVRIAPQHFEGAAAGSGGRSRGRRSVSDLVAR
jgi:hypothetical protein